MKQKIQNLNDVVSQFISSFNALGYGYINGVYEKANKIVLTITAYDKRSYEFLECVSKILKNQLYSGDILFLSNGRLNIYDTINSNYKLYSITIFKEKFEDENEYIERLLIFYKNILEYTQNGKRN